MNDEVYQMRIERPTFAIRQSRECCRASAASTWTPPRRSISTPDNVRSMFPPRILPSWALNPGRWWGESSYEASACAPSLYSREHDHMIRTLRQLVYFVTLCAVALTANSLPAAEPTHTFAIGEQDFLLDGQPLSSVAAKSTPPACRASTGGIDCRWPRRWASTPCAPISSGTSTNRVPGEFNWSDQADIASTAASRKRWACG